MLRRRSRKRSRQKEEVRPLEENQREVEEKLYYDERKMKVKNTHIYIIGGTQQSKSTEN